MAEAVRSLGFAAVDWIEHYLVHGPGDVQGKPIELDDELAAFIVKAYRLERDGSRCVRRAFLSRPKGRNKSGLAAMIACFEALGPCRFDHFARRGQVSPWGYRYAIGEPVGAPLGYVEILNVATEEGQAGNTYDAIYFMLNPETCSPQLAADFGAIDIGLARTNLPDRRGFIEPVTSADSSKDGAKSTFIVADETHLWLLPRLKRLHGIMTRNLLKRKAASGWMLETSTMYGEGEDSVAESTHAYARTLKRTDRTLLFDHRQASEDWDLADRAQRLKALEQAYGPAAAWMNLDAICDSWDDPQVSESEFRRYWLNQPVPMIEPPKSVFGAGMWERCAHTKAERPEQVAFGFAVSPEMDSAVVVAVGRLEDGRVYGETVAMLDSPAKLVDKLVALAKKWAPCAVAYNAKGASASVEADLLARGFSKDPSGDEWRLVGLGPGDYAQACMALKGDIIDEDFWHPDEEPLNEAVAGAGTRPLGEGWAWSRKGSKADIGPLEALTAARHGFMVYATAEEDVWCQWG